MLFRFLRALQQNTAQSMLLYLLSTSYSPILVLAYDLLKDRRTIDVTITKFLPLCFKMAESLEDLGNILRGWEKDEVKKSRVEELNRYENREEEI